MLSGVSVVCFAASYFVAWGLEIVSVRYRFGWHRLALLVFAWAGFLAHTIYLGVRGAAFPSTPLSSAYDWFLLSAWLLAAAYLGVTLYQKQSPFGIFLPPMTLCLILAATLASDVPIRNAANSRFWPLLHSWVILVGTVSLTIGFLTGSMYLLQSYFLKHKVRPISGFRLPSLESLERGCGWSLFYSTLFMLAGFFSGTLLRIRQIRPGDLYPMLVDPVVLSLAGVSFWLVIAESFRHFYVGARRGHKVAYLTIASFLLFAITVAFLVSNDSIHATQPLPSDQQEATR